MQWLLQIVRDRRTWPRRHASTPAHSCPAHQRRDQPSVRKFPCLCSFAKWSQGWWHHGRSLCCQIENKKTTVGTGLARKKRYRSKVVGTWRHVVLNYLGKRVNFVDLFPSWQLGVFKEFLKSKEMKRLPIYAAYHMARNIHSRRESPSCSFSNNEIHIHHNAKRGAAINETIHLFCRRSS